MATINLRNLDNDLFRRFKAQQALDGFTMKAKLERLMELDLEKMVVVQPIDGKGKKK